MFLITFRAYYILQTIAFCLFTFIALKNVRPATIHNHCTQWVLCVLKVAMFTFRSCIPSKRYHICNIFVKDTVEFDELLTKMLDS